MGSNNKKGSSEFGSNAANKGKSIIYHQKKNGKITLNRALLRSFIEEKGFCIYNETLIQIIDGIALLSTPQMVFNIVLEDAQNRHIPDLENAVLKECESILISQKGFLGSLTKTQLTPLRDERDTYYKPYVNGLVKVTKNKIELLEHKDSCFIWADSIIDRYFERCNETSVFELFLRKVTNDEDHYNSNRSAIGYLAHKYKIPSLAKCVIISDELTQVEDAPNGRTGKGLIVQGLSELTNLITLNGKQADFASDKFAFQAVTLQTEIIFIDDVKKGFDFETLFSVITNDMTVEKKNKPSFIIKASVSPKLVSTSNYQIKGNSSSHSGRRFEVYLNNYFDTSYTPIDEFGHHFFLEWDSAEWNRFDNFMMRCVQLYLEQGLIKYDNSEIRRKRIISEIGSERYQKFDTLEMDKFYFLKDLNETSIKNIQSFADYRGLKLISSKNGGITTIKLTFQQIDNQ